MSAASFASGVLPIAEAELFKAIRPVEIRSINLFNVNAIDQILFLYVQRGTGETKHVYARFELAQYERADAINNPLNLSVGDSIRGVSTTLSAVEYIVTGVDRP